MKKKWNPLYINFLDRKATVISQTNYCITKRYKHMLISHLFFSSDPIFRIGIVKGKIF